MTLQVLGRYQLLKEIASGGMATVYAARSAGAGGFQKLVAVKRMLPHLTSEQRFKDMFLDEARLTANIRSPYAVATLDLGEAEDGSLFLVMDLVIGSSFAEILRGCNEQGRVLPVGAVVEIVQQAARGLHDAHEATTPLGEPLHIVHRDVSPQNILVGIDGASRITDFGVAHALERLTKTKGRDIKGKLAYCSPEQARGEVLDARSDVFALGIVLWEGLTHHRLFKGQSTSETVFALLNDEIPDPRTLRPEVPYAIAAVVAKALERAPADRYQSALEFAEALRGAVTEHVRTEDLRDLVKLIAGESISELVADIRAAIEATTPDASRSWDDAPTVKELSTPPEPEEESRSATLEGLKQTGQFLALPPSEAMVAASTRPFRDTPSTTDSSSSVEDPGSWGPRPRVPRTLEPPRGLSDGSSVRSSSLAAPSAVLPAGPSRGKWVLLLVVACLATAALTVAVVSLILRPSIPDASESAAGGAPQTRAAQDGPAPLGTAPSSVVSPGTALPDAASLSAAASGTGSPSAETPAASPSETSPVLGQTAAEAVLAPGFDPPLWSTKGHAGGAQSAAELSSECTGYTPATPQHIIELDQPFPRLRLFVYSDANTSLVVRSPSGVYCNDDGAGRHPVIDQAFPAGRYEIFVGSSAAARRPEYTIGISEDRESSPRSFAPRRRGRTSMRSPESSLGASMGDERPLREPWVDSRPSSNSTAAEVPAPRMLPAPSGEPPAAPILR